MDEKSRQTGAETGLAPSLGEKLRVRLAWRGGPPDPKGPGMARGEIEAAMGRPVSAGGAWSGVLAAAAARVLAPHLPSGVEAQVSLAFVDAETMRGLKGRYLGEEAPTDVLSFPLFAEGGAFRPPAWDRIPLGDLLICPSVVATNAREAGRSFWEELALVFVHGLLHLVGFDHGDEESRDRMWAEQDRHVPSLAGELEGIPPERGKED